METCRDLKIVEDEKLENVFRTEYKKVFKYCSSSPKKRVQMNYEKQLAYWSRTISTNEAKERAKPAIVVECSCLFTLSFYSTYQLKTRDRSSD